MISTNDCRPGMALALPEGLFTILEYQHVKPGKGKAFVRMRLRNLDNGTVSDRTFRADEDVEQAIIERRNHQFLYKDDLGFHFMDVSDYSQIALPSEDVGSAASYLVEATTATLALYQGNAIGVELPASVELNVTFAEPGVKGDRVSGGTKPVTLQTGLVIQAPLFINQGDRIKVDTRSGAYISRA